MTVADSTTAAWGNGSAWRTVNVEDSSSTKQFYVTKTDTSHNEVITVKKLSFKTNEIWKQISFQFTAVYKNLPHQISW